MKNSETQPNQYQPPIEPELDIRGLCRSLWQGKILIVAFAVIFAAVALGASYFMQQNGVQPRSPTCQLLII